MKIHITEESDDYLGMLIDVVECVRRLPQKVHVYLISTTEYPDHVIKGLELDGVLQDLAQINRRLN